MLSAWENTLLLFLCKANGGFALWMAQALLQCRALLSRLAWAIHHSESMNMNAGGGSHGGELREPEGGLASHEACSRQPSCSLIRAPSITLALYSICGSWFSYYGELPFPNFKAHVFIKASEIIFTLQLWFLPIVTRTNYHKLSGKNLHKFFIIQFWGQKLNMGLPGLTSRY